MSRWSKPVPGQRLVSSLVSIACREYASYGTSGRSRQAGPLPTSSALTPSEGTVAQRESIEAALASWRAAERQLAAATNGDTDNLQIEVVRCRGDFQRLSAEHMIEW